MLDLLVVGNLVVDDVVHADGTTQMAQPGGAVLYVALAARLFGLKVGIASRVGDAYPPSMLDALADRGIAVDGIAPMDGPGLRLWLLEEGTRRQLVHRLDGPSHVEACPVPSELPDAWRRPRAVHLAPMPFAAQEAWVEAMGGSCHLSLDPFELLRDGELDLWRRLLRRVDLFLFSEDEMSASDSGAYVDALAEAGPIVAYKQGAAGGLLAHAEQRLRWTSLTTEPTGAGPVDATGAGDAFAAGFVAARLKGKSLRSCAHHGAAVASLAVEGRGPDGLLQADRDALSRRLAV